MQTRVVALFPWLCTTNAGASEVRRAALHHQGLDDAELAGGSMCDQTTKSDLRVVAKASILLRLSRNLNKVRGSVNGAHCVVEESLRGNAVFTARLVATGNMVLIHPM